MDGDVIRAVLSISEELETTKRIISNINTNNPEVFSSIYFRVYGSGVSIEEKIIDKEISQEVYHFIRNALVKKRNKLQKQLDDL